jgi:pre-mRNA-splicing factor CWC22
VNLDDEFDPEETLNIFRFDPSFEKSEEEWNAIKLEILGEENVLKLKQMQKVEEEIEEEEEEQVEDFTE